MEIRENLWQIRAGHNEPIENKTKNMIGQIIYFHFLDQSGFNVDVDLISSLVG